MPSSAFPADQSQAKEAISSLIKREGLDKITSSSIRAHLKETFNVDFAEFKRDVDNLTKQVIESQSKSTGRDDDSDSSDDDNDVTPAKKSGGGGAGDTTTTTGAADSDSDSSDPGVASHDRARPVKKRTLKRKASPVDDGSVDLMSGVKSRQRAAAKQATNNMKRTAPRTSRKKEKNDDPDPEPKFGKMTKLCLISDELQLVTERKFMKRCDVVRCMWEYIRRHDLFDPKDRRFALCDDILSPIFKSKKFKAFSMMKMLAKHIMDPELISQEMMDESEREKEKLIQEWRARQAALAENNEDEGKSCSAAPTSEDGDASRDATQSTQGDDSMNGSGQQSDDDEREGDRGDAEKEGEEDEGRDSEGEGAAKKSNDGGESESDSYESDSD